MRGAAALACTLVLAGCIRSGVRLAPLPPEAQRAGLTQSDYILRRSLALGAFDSASALVAPGSPLAPDDDLLASLYRASAAYYAGRYDVSGAALEHAAILADDRFTKSVSKNLLALVTNDNRLPYEPGQTERLMMNYYGMLDYLRRGDPEGAAVEARRLSALLESYDTRKDSVDVRTRALLNYLAGATFEAAGEKNDADVSYRVARALVGDTVLPFPGRARAKPGKGLPATSGTSTKAVSPSTSAVRAAKAVTPPTPTGELIVVVEHGYVAHRVPRLVLVPITSSEMEKLGGKPTETLEAALAITVRTVAFMSLQPNQLVWRDNDDDREVTMRDTVTVAYLLPVAWTSFRRPYRPQWRVSLTVDSTFSTAVPVAADLSDAVANDFRRSRAGMLTRGIARAAAKLALAKTAEQAAEKKHGEFAGSLTRWTLDAVNVYTERADIRQWRLLPGEISVVRLTLPAGQHSLTLDYGAAGRLPRRIALGQTRIAADKIAFATARVWDDGVVEVGPTPALVAAPAATVHDRR
jgi:hypothetical protein